MATFRVEYRIKGYSMADALRPDPMWGRRIFTVDGDRIGSNDPLEIRQAAAQTAPSGYYLHTVTPNDRLDGRP